jgi:hypothetical protein
MTEATQVISFDVTGSDNRGVRGVSANPPSVVAVLIARRIGRELLLVSKIGVLSGMGVGANWEDSMCVNGLELR